MTRLGILYPGLAAEDDYPTGAALLRPPIDVEVVEVDLHARVENGLRAFGGAAAVGRRRLPRDRHEDDERLLFRMRKAENSRAGLGGRIRIENHAGVLSTAFQNRRRRLSIYGFARYDPL